MTALGRVATTGIVALLLACGCTNVRTCKQGTLLLTLTFDDATTKADSVRLTLGVGGQSTTATRPHSPGDPVETIEVDFPGSYPLGSAVSIDVTAFLAGAAVGGGHAGGTLVPGCSALSLALRPDTIPDAGGEDIVGVDFAIGDARGAPGDGGSIADIAVADFQDTDLALAHDLAETEFAAPDLTAPDLAIPDLGIPDLAMSDLAQSDLAMPDMAAPFGTVSFRFAPSYPAGASPSCVAAGDLDGDGKLDLVVVGSAGVSWIMGRGDGTFGAPKGMNVAAGANALVLGDFNGDNKLDVAAALSMSQRITVLLGDGMGGFTGTKESLAGGAPGSMAVGDLDGNGRLDLAVALPQLNEVAILTGAGDGTFQSSAILPTGMAPVAPVLALLDGDQKLDLAVVNGGSKSLMVFFGNGNATFQPSLSTGLGDAPLWLAAGDLDGDGHLDIAVPLAGGSVAALMNDGHGAFVGAVGYKMSSKLVAIADVTGDGTADVAGLSSVVGVLTGQGGGALAPGPRFAAGDSAAWMVAADLDGDKVADLAVTNQASGTVSVLLSRNGSLFAAPATPTPASAGLVVAAQLNPQKDHRLDVAYTYQTNWAMFYPPYAVAWMFGAGDGSFSGGSAAGLQAMSFYSPISLEAADVSGDGKADLLSDLQPWCSGGAGDDFTDVVVSNGDGTLQPLVRSGTDSGCFQIASRLYDFDGDGKLDALLATNADRNGQGGGNFAIYVAENKGDGSGTFNPPLPVGMINQPVVASAIADFNGDQLPDLAFASTNPKSVAILLAQAKLIYNPPAFTGLDDTPRRIVAADFNGDGWPDLALSTNNGVVVLTNNADGKGTFGPATKYDQGLDCNQLLVVDINNDQIPDVLYRGGPSAMKILVNKGKALFLPPKAFAPGMVISDLAPGDFNGDGKLDVALAFGAGVAVLVNTSP